MLLVNINRLTYKKCQQGVVLIVALMLLLVMTLIGVTLMSDAISQERMAGNTRQLSLEQANAEGALRQAESFLEGLNILSTPNIAPRVVIANSFHTLGDGRYVGIVEKEFNQYAGSFDPLTTDLNAAANWAGVNSIAANPTTSAGTAPAYTIEYIGRLQHGEPAQVEQSDEVKDFVSTSPFVFRITAIGYGANSNISAVLQSVYSTSE